MDFSSIATNTLLTDTLEVARSDAETLPVTSRFERPLVSQPTSRQTTTTEAIPSSITGTWGAIARSHMTVGMYGNLVKLASVSDGWSGPHSRALNATAINRFLDFWQLVKNDAVEPSLTLAPDGSLVAEWFKSARQRLDVRYSPRALIFGLITPKNILEGAESAETVATILKVHPQKPLQWREAKG